jgi:amino acid adenylation domain-containing protein
VEPLIGFFVNTLALRVKWESEWRVAELLRAVREVCLGGYSHQELPFEKLVEEMQPERSLSRTPLFQVMLVLHNASMDTLELPGLALQAVESAGTTAKFDLTLTLAEGEGTLGAELEYNTDLFEAESIKRMFSHLETLLGAMSADSDARLNELPLLTAAERHQLLYGWNETGAPVPPQSVQQLFEAQVERTPDALALVFEDERLTYRELNGRANQVAHYLRELGVEADVLVGLLMERSVELAVSVLGVLKAGGAYLPLDPLYPPERLSFMLENTPPKVLMTQQRFADEIPPHQARVLFIETEWETIAKQSQANLINIAHPDNLLYVIYTSGSTGRPKGIGLSHRALTNLIWWHLNSLTTGLKTLQFASLSFDASFHEMFAAWCSGGTLFLISETLRLDVAALSSYVLEEGIEKLILPVVVLQQMAQEYGFRKKYPHSFKEVTTTGEQMQITPPVISLFKELRQCALHNHYGPAETHVVTALTLAQDRDQWLRYPTIGRPIANTQIYILDKEMNPAPINTLGELFIGGVSLARGYLNNPELTAGKFIPDPFSTETGARLYRTGDLSRYLNDGTIEFLGRIDHQVKIRGYRIEPGEVEAILLQHPSVRETVVQARPDESGQTRLVAYVVFQSSEVELAPKVDELRQHLASQLPEYMIPGAFVLLAGLPLTPNGKVDREALPAPRTERPELSSTYVAPRTALESVVAGIWTEVLSLERIGIHDNFFDLGGHSMLATRVTFRVREALLVELPLRSLFESPTVAGLIEVITQLWGDRTTAEKVAETHLEVERLTTS